jgi:acyl-coenzyme A thioesterase PaaI-like protein
MLDPALIIEKAKHSAFYLWLLNRSLDRMVPFNRPHRFRITKIEDDRVQTRIPFFRKNFNHIRGLHACALATLSEFTTGFLLVSKLDGKKFRLIMQRIEVEYHYQGKRDAVGEFSASPAWLKKEIYEPLQTRDAVVVPCEIKLYDVQGNHLTTGHVHWQVKRWDKVKTRV